VLRDVLSNSLEYYPCHRFHQHPHCHFNCFVLYFKVIDWRRWDYFLNDFIAWRMRGLIIQSCSSFNLINALALCCFALLYRTCRSLYFHVFIMIVSKVIHIATRRLTKPEFVHQVALARLNRIPLLMQLFSLPCYPGNRRMDSTNVGCEERVCRGGQVVDWTGSGRQFSSQINNWTASFLFCSPSFPSSG
jgi:hypothetical protein